MAKTRTPDEIVKTAQEESAKLAPRTRAVVELALLTRLLDGPTPPSPDLVYRRIQLEVDHLVELL